jgi:gluconokinase
MGANPHVASTRPTQPYVLALDIGTSSARAGLYGPAGSARPGTRAQRRYSVETTPDGGAELDPEMLFQAVCDAMDEALARAGRARLLAVAPCTF